MQSATRPIASHLNVRPGERGEYEALVADLGAELAPATVIEQTFAKLALHATWRLRRCDRFESRIQPDDHDALQSVDRTRAQATNSLRRALAELRKLQTERRLRAELLPEGTDTSTHGLASYKEIVSTLAKNTKRTQAAGPAPTLKDIEELLDKTNPLKGLSVSEIARRTHPAAGQIARTAPCPCRSGQKFKRCCGRTAPGSHPGSFLRNAA